MSLDSGTSSDLESPELVKAAATKIQAAFRGKKVRDDFKKIKENETKNSPVNTSFLGLYK